MSVEQKARIKPRRESDVVILPITNGVDVFTGKGWDQWTRFETKGGYPKLIAGVALSDKQYGLVHSTVTGAK
jgi:hypothetical protein